MSRRVSKFASALLALSLCLSAPAAFGADYRSRDINPGLGPRIVKIVKHLAKRFGIVTNEDIQTAWPGPPKP